LPLRLNLTAVDGAPAEVVHGGQVRIDVSEDAVHLGERDAGVGDGLPALGHGATVGTRGTNIKRSRSGDPGGVIAGIGRLGVAEGERSH